MALTELQILFRRCLHRRVDATEFGEVLKQYKSRQRVGSREVVSAYIYCCFHFCVEGDPLLPSYLQEILLSSAAVLIDFVTALLLQWKNMPNDGDQPLIQKTISTQTRIVTELNIILATNMNFNVEQLRKCTILTARWLTAMVKWALGNDMKDNIHAQNLTEVTGFLLVSQLNLNTLQNAPDMYNAVQQALDQCMGTFPSVSMQLMNLIGTMQKPTQESTNSVEPHEMEMAALQFEEGVILAPIVAIRSATVTLLQHLLTTGGTIDDATIYAFLNTRHAGNHAVMFNDLAFAAMEVTIKSAVNELHQHQCEIFLYNKLPSILSIIVTSSFESFSSEDSLVDAWNYINTAAPDTAPSVRRLLHVSAYLHLIRSETVTGLVEDDTTLKGLYAKDDLVSQVTANHARGPRLIDELLKNDGNAGSIVQAIYEIMNNYCHLRETQHLKDMANTIVRKPNAINAIGMFIKPAMFLTSLCTLLDEWKWDDIHGESQPVYDEFGSVFLLVLAFKERLQLSDSELGIQQKGFLVRYLCSKNSEQVKMSESTQKHLGDWIKSLYIDEGLSDELTANCSAQEFYMLVPTLLRHSVNAHLKGKLSYETLKAGLEYLLEPFLLPSLVPAIGWIENIEAKTAQLVMQILTKPPGGEARDTHQTILAMASDHLQSDMLPKSRFGLNAPQGELSQIVAETYFSLNTAVRAFGSVQVVRTIVSMMLQGDFHTLLDYVATMIVVNDLRKTVQVIRGKLGHYLKEGENLFAEALVHVSRRVELYASALTPQDMTMEQFVPMNIANVANVNLDAVPTTFQPAPEQNTDIDQMLKETAMGMEQLDSTNLDDMYGLQSGDFTLENLDDLDLDSMF